MKIANGIEMLEIHSNMMGKPTIIYPTLIRDNDEVILVDAGYPGQLPLIREAIENTGVEFNKLSKVVLTHQDIDHVGSLSDILKELPNSVKVLAHEEEKPYIEGEKSPHKVARLEASFNSLSEDMKKIYEMLKAGFQNSKVKVDETLTDNEELPYCGGITVVYTPGHTIGHICLYFKQNKILIAGDVFAVEEGRLVKARDFINYDKDLSAKSLKRLAEYDIETVICYHGGIYNNKANERIGELARC